MRTAQRIGRIPSKATQFGHDIMRSRLERDFAKHLYESGEDYQYEPRVFGPKGRRYLPDFLVAGRSGRKTYIEVKPRADEVEAAKLKMSVIWDDEPDALLVVACSEGCVYHSALRGGEWSSWVERWAHK
ncbi:MAG: hypothetical protein KKE65_01980 [Actinobacteria bacterium]|nr:hypothetical protein [Actinomycetota bacterium]